MLSEFYLKNFQVVPLKGQKSAFSSSPAPVHCIPTWLAYRCDGWRGSSHLRPQDSSQMLRGLSNKTESTKVSNVCSAGPTYLNIHIKQKPVLAVASQGPPPPLSPSTVSPLVSSMTLPTPSPLTNTRTIQDHHPPNHHYPPITFIITTVVIKLAFEARLSDLRILLTFI